MLNFELTVVTTTILDWPLFGIEIFVSY